MWLAALRPTRHVVLRLNAEGDGMTFAGAEAYPLESDRAGAVR